MMTTDSSLLPLMCLYHTAVYVVRLRCCKICRIAKAVIASTQGRPPIHQ